MTALRLRPDRAYAADGKLRGLCTSYKMIAYEKESDFYRKYLAASKPDQLVDLAASLFANGFYAMLFTGPSTGDDNFQQMLAYSKTLPACQFAADLFNDDIQAIASAVAPVVELYGLDIDDLKLTEIFHLRVTEGIQMMKEQFSHEWLLHVLHRLANNKKCSLMHLFRTYNSALAARLIYCDDKVANELLAGETPVPKDKSARAGAGASDDVKQEPNERLFKHMLDAVDDRIEAQGVGLAQAIEKLQEEVRTLTPPPKGGTVMGPDDVSKVVELAAELAASRAAKNTQSSAKTLGDAGGDCSAAPKPAWMRMPDVAGLSKAVEPSCERAYAQRPMNDWPQAKVKTRLQTLQSKYSDDLLLSLVPAPGATDKYVRVRQYVLEGWYVNRYILGTGWEDELADMSLLFALRQCASVKSNQAKDKETSARWQTLEAAESVSQFVHLLDSLFMDSADNADELEWQSAEHFTGNALSLFHTIRPLIKHRDSAKRAKQLIHKRLAAIKDVASMSALSACRDDPAALNDWEKVLDASKTIHRVIESTQAKPSIKEGGTRGINAFGRGERVNGTEVSESAELGSAKMPFWAALNMDADVTQAELLEAWTAVVRMRATQQGLSMPPSQHTQFQAPPPVNPVKPPEGAGSQSSSSTSSLMQQLAAFGRGEYKPIFNLPLIYPFLGFSEHDVPPAGPGANAANGKCKVCVYMGKTQHVSYEEYKDPKNIPAGAVYDHNPYKCRFCVEAVSKRAKELGTSEAEVAVLLTPLPTPPWGKGK